MTNNISYNLIEVDKIESKCQELLQVLYDRASSELSESNMSLTIGNSEFLSEDDDIDDAVSKSRSLNIDVSRDCKSIDIEDFYGNTPRRYLNEPISRLVDGSLIPNFKIAFILFEIGNTETLYELE